MITYRQQVTDTDCESNGKGNWALDIIPPTVTASEDDEDEEEGHNQLNQETLWGRDAGLETISTQTIRHVRVGRNDLLKEISY